MDENKVYPAKDNSGPMRETAHGVLEREIAQLRRRADALEALLLAIGPVGKGSKAEEALWDILVSSRAIR
jgi:hypothetical protein